MRLQSVKTVFGKTFSFILFIFPLSDIITLLFSFHSWYGVMKKCWAHQPDKRPTFSDVRNQLDGLFEAAPGDDYYYYKR